MRGLTLVLAMAWTMVACGPSDLELQQTIGTRVSATSRAVQSQFTPTAITRPTPTAGPVPSPTATPGPPPLTEQQVIGLFQERLRGMKPDPRPYNCQGADFNVSCFGFLTSGDYWESGNPPVSDWHAVRTGDREWRVWGNNLDKHESKMALIRYNFIESGPRFSDGLWTAGLSNRGC